MSQALVNALFLAVSSVSLVVQSFAIRKLATWPSIPTADQLMVHRSMIRTVACRITAACMYVLLGIYTITVGPNIALSLGLFTLVQLLWQINSVADIRLRHKLNKGK